MTTRTSRISPHTLSPHTILDHLAALTHCRISSGRVRIPCPAHGGTNPNLALWVNDDGIAARCHSTGCSYADIAAAIETRFGLSINPRRHHYNPIPVAARATSTRRTPQPGPNAQDLRPYALRLWHHSLPIPYSTSHPARLWLASRQLWRPDLPLPGPVRWIGAEDLHRDFQGAGAVIAIAAPPTAWTASWPTLPDLSSLHLVYVARDGTPAVDRGLTKRTYAPAADAVIVLGCPHLQTAAAPLDVAEGPRRCPRPRGQKPSTCSLHPGHLRHELPHNRRLAGDLAGNPGMGRPRRVQGRTGSAGTAPRAAAGAPDQRRRWQRTGPPRASSSQGLGRSRSSTGVHRP